MQAADLFFVCVCVHLCVMCACVHICEGVHMWETEVRIMCLPLVLSTLFEGTNIIFPLYFNILFVLIL